MNKQIKILLDRKLLATQILTFALLCMSGCGRNTTLESEQAKTSDMLEEFIETGFADKAVMTFDGVRQLNGTDTEVVVAGRIGGRIDPFAKGFAAFVLTGEKVQFCDEMGDNDHCQTSWDACCEDPDLIANHRALVQLTGLEGLPLPLDLKESGVLIENQTVTVVGKLDVQSTSGNLIINATKIYLQHRL